MGNCTVKNYTDQGGSVTHIAGELVIEKGGKLKIGNAEIKQASAVANATGSTVTKAEFNALLEALRGAGILKKS